MSPLDMLSVHVPKCAGTAFFKALESAYGRRALLVDYDDFPLDPAAPMNLDPEGCFSRWHNCEWPQLRRYRVIHGHYHIHKYSRVSARLRITFLRDPLDRLVSHYFFWKNTQPRGHSLHAYTLEQKLSLEEFARLPNVRRCYTGVFFRGVDIGEFDFVGFYEQAGSDVARLSKLAGIDLDLPVVNANPQSGYGRAVAELRADPARLARIRNLLADDIAFYEEAKRKFGAP